MTPRQHRANRTVQYPRDSYKNRLAFCLRKSVQRSGWWIDALEILENFRLPIQRRADDDRQDARPFLARCCEQRGQFVGGDEVRGEEIGTDEKNGDLRRIERRANLVVPAVPGSNSGVVPQIDTTLPLERPQWADCSGKAHCHVDRALAYVRSDVSHLTARGSDRVGRRTTAGKVLPSSSLTDGRPPRVGDGPAGGYQVNRNCGGQVHGDDSHEMRASPARAHAGQLYTVSAAGALNLPLRAS